MKNIDVKLSEEVAKEASKKINCAKKELEENKDSFNLFLRETVNDSREHVAFLKKIVKILLISFIIFAVVAVGGLIAMGIYNQHLIKNMAYDNSQKMKQMADDNAQKIMDFMNQFDFYSEVEILNELSDYNQNNLNITK